MLAERNQNQIELFEYLAVVYRQRYWFIGIAAIIFVCGAIVIFLLPNTYMAQSEILIEQEAMFSVNEETPNDKNIVHRAHAIIKTVMTNENIEKILKAHGMVEEDVSGVELFRAINAFRESTNLEFENVEIVNPTTGKEGMISVGLRIQYENESPDLAYNVTNELTNLILNANTGKVSGEDERRLTFLKERMDVVLDEVKQSEKEVANFKDKNALFLPEMYPLVVERSKTLEAKLLESGDRLQLLNQREDEILADIATTSEDALLYSPDGTRVIGPEENLMMLETEFTEKASRYSPNHPELARLRKEITALRTQVDTSDTSGIEIELNAAKEQLAATLDRYTSSHPDVENLQAKIASFERMLEEAQPRSAPRSTSEPNNPAYMRLLTRLETVREEINQEKRRQENLNNLLDESQNQIQRIPSVAQALEELDRDRQRALVKYREIENQLVQTELTKNMRDANLFDRFLLIEPPVYPTVPFKPNKKIMLAVLMVLAVALGYLVALVKEWLSDRIRNSYDLEQYVDVPVYVVPRF